MAQETLLDPGFLHSQRVARLATADRGGQPLAAPVCFAYDGAHFYIVLDEKPKRVSPAALKPVRNIQANPRVALVLDQYDEEWRRLWYVLVQGMAELLTGGEGHEGAIELLREKYPQYREMDIGNSPVIRITPRRMLPWRATPPTEGRR